MSRGSVVYLAEKRLVRTVLQSQRKRGVVSPEHERAIVECIADIAKACRALSSHDLKIADDEAECTKP